MLYTSYTALLRVQQDTDGALDKHCAMVIVMLDKYSAFETIDHDIYWHYCITSTVPGVKLHYYGSWRIWETAPTVSIIEYNIRDYSATEWYVTQDSVLGPVVFTLYTFPIERVS